MYQEAAEAAACVARQYTANAATVAALAGRLAARPPRLVVTCARGSSDHAATFGQYLLTTRLALPTASLPPSVGSVYGVRPQLDDALFIAISQSGRSPDLLAATRLARAGGAQVLALVNVEDSPLAALADEVLPLHAGPETSVAATKSHLCSLAVLLQLVAHWADDAALRDALDVLPEAMREAWRQDWTTLVEGLREVRGLFVLGRGLGLAAACEAALKLKETCGLHAEAFSSAEVRHGPMAIVDRTFPVLAFVQDDATAAGTLATVADFRVRGAPVWLARPGASGARGLPLPPSPHPACTPLLAVQAFYRAANALSLARGLDPDVPPHLEKVTETT